MSTDDREKPYWNKYTVIEITEGKTIATTYLEDPLNPFATHSPVAYSSEDHGQEDQKSVEQ